MQVHKEEWEASYARGDNAIFYPKEEVVKFLNRHVRKRTGLTDFRNILEKAAQDHTPWRALDFGCGIGRHAILLEEFGFEAHGVDLAEKSIDIARGLARHMGRPGLAARLNTCDGCTLAFDDAAFDVCIAESCLDSMPFDLAREIVRELDRVTKYLGYISLYAGWRTGFPEAAAPDEHAGELVGDVPVLEPLACGTVRCYYNWPMIGELIAGTNWRVRAAHLVEERSLTVQRRHGRYYVVLGKTAGG